MAILSQCLIFAPSARSFQEQITPVAFGVGEKNCRVVFDTQLKEGLNFLTGVLSARKLKFELPTQEDKTTFLKRTFERADVICDIKPELTFERTVSHSISYYEEVLLPEEARKIEK